MTEPPRLAVRVREPADVQADLDAAIDAIGPLDEEAMRGAQVHLDGLTKPPGSLGRLEELVVRLGGITGRVAAPVERRSIVIAAADHGLAARGVSAYPADVTRQMVANFLRGGAAIDALATAVGASVVVVDVGVAGPALDVPPDVPLAARFIQARVRGGTADMLLEPAMHRDEARQAIGVGLDVARALAAEGVQLLGLGEMGIGNTAAASAMVAAMTGLPVDAVTGSGTGLDAVGRERKVRVLEDVLSKRAPDPADPIGVLAAVGGLEIAALTGLLLGAAAARIPVVLDGFITGAAALVAAALAPQVVPRCIAGHRSVEPGHAVVLERLGLTPLLDLDLRLGEGTGAALAMGLVVAAAAARDGMATFASAGVASAVERSGQTADGGHGAG